MCEKSEEENEMGVFKERKCRAEISGLSISDAHLTKDIDPV